MITVWAAECRKSLLIFTSDKAQVFFVIFVPVLLVFFASYAVRGLLVSSSRYQLPVIDLDQSAGSASVIAALKGDRDLDLDVQQRTAFSDADAAATLGGGKRVAALVIPKGAGEAVSQGQPVAFPLIVDPTQGTRYNLLALAVQRALVRFSAPQAAVQIVADAAGVPQDEVDGTVRSRIGSLLAAPAIKLDEQPTTRGQALPNAYDQTVPGIALMWAITFFGYAATTAYEERSIFRTWARTLGTPASRAGIVLGKLTANYLMVAFLIGTLFVVGRLAFGMDLGSPVALLAVLVIFTAVPAAIGTLMAVAGFNPQLATAISTVGTFVIGAISGALVPLYVLPQWLERLAIISPLYWGTAAAQDVMIRGAAFADILTPLVALLVLAAVLAGASIMRLSSARQ